MRTLFGSITDEYFIIKNGGTPESIGKDVRIIGASKDGECVYYMKYSEGVLGALYVRKGDKTILLSDNDNNRVCFNEDMTEIMFNYGDSTYVSINGNEKILVADVLLKDIIIPKNCIGKLDSKEQERPTIYGINTFINKVMICKDGSLRLIGDQYQTKVISSKIDPSVIAISEEGNDLLYGTTDLGVIKVSDLLGKCSQSICIVHKDDVVFSNNLNQIYFTDNDQLYYITEQGKSQYITEGITNLCLNQAGDTAFFLKDRGTLYYSHHGGDAKPVEGIGSVSIVYEGANGIIVGEEVDGKYKLYYNTKGTKFKLIIEHKRLYY